MGIFGDIEHGVDHVADDAGDVGEDVVDPGSQELGNNPFGSKASQTPVGEEVHAQQSGRMPGADGAASSSEDAEAEAIDAAAAADE